MSTESKLLVVAQCVSCMPPHESPPPVSPTKTVAMALLTTSLLAAGVFLVVTGSSLCGPVISFGIEAGKRLLGALRPRPTCPQCGQ
jgi:hypothetical protein